MAREYIITHRWQGPTETVIKRRRDSASFALRTMVYDMVAGFAGLDTAWGWEAYRKSVRIACDIERGVPKGWTDRIDIHHGESIIIRA